MRQKRCDIEVEVQDIGRCEFGHKKVRIWIAATKQTQDKLQAVCQLINKTSKASKEEEHANLELNNCETEYKDSQETLAHKIANLDQTYIALVDLGLDHDNIRKEGNIIEYEKKTEIPNTNSQQSKG